MNTETPNASSLRGTAQPRDRTAHRRAYLDTYARRSRGSSEQSNQQPASAAPEMTQQVQAPTYIAPQVNHTPQTSPKASQIVQPPVNHAIETDYIKPQPPVFTSNHHVGPMQEVQRVASPQAPQQDSVDNQQDYLDTLTRRSAQTIPANPASVAKQVPVNRTQHAPVEVAPEDPVQEQRIAANLNALYSGSLTSMISSDEKSASAAHIRTIVASAFACGIMAVGMFTFMGNYSSQPVVAQPIGAPVIEVEASAATPKEAPAQTNDATSRVAVNPEQPIRLVISSIGVNAPVEGLGTTPEGLIAVPKSYGVVGWYNKGVLPGKPGPAVLVGHYAGGNRAVFDNLKDLKDGDLITTTNGKGQSFTYRVTAKNEYEKDKVPMAQIFKKGNDSRLEIITCSGKWQSNTYDKRLVITAELVK